VKVYIDGKLYAEEDARIRVLTAGVRDGYALRERFICRSGNFFHLDERLEQLRTIGDELGLSLTWDAAAVTEAMAVTYDMNELGGLDASLELILAAGDGDGPATVVVIAEKRPTGPAKAASPVALVTLEDFPVDGALLALERNLLGQTGTRLARTLAKKKKADGAILLAGDGCIGTCTDGEIFAVRDKSFWIPEVKRRPIIGQFAIDLLGDLGIKTNVQKLKLRDLKASAECFLINGLCEVVPVTAIDGSKFGDGKPGSKTQSLAKDLAGKLRTESREAFHI
jgi:branched-subunit amino acid aminotransferase/4-amino-4-deoxychorismate lyase